jgi:hypothetical protein
LNWFSQIRRKKRGRIIAAMSVTEDQREDGSNATSDSWLARLVAFIAWLLDSIARLKRVRRTTTFKPGWRDNWNQLREIEWQRHQMLAQGAALLLSGRTLDDADYVPHPMPADFGGPCPTSPFEMNRRMLLIADFLRDPETHIRRHAARIAKRCSIDFANPLAAHGSTNAALRRAAHHEAVDVSPNEAKEALILSSTRSVRPSKDERGLAKARAPPTSPNSLLAIPCSPQTLRV